VGVAFEVEHRVDDVLMTRGPASVPSLVTWPTRITLVPLDLAKRVSCAAHSRTCATEPGADVSASLQSVWMESTTRRPAARRRGVEDLLQLDLGLHAHALPRGRAGASAAPPARRSLAGDVEHRHRARQRRRAPAAAASTCRCPGRRRSARRRRQRCRRRARGRARRCRSAGGVASWASISASVDTASAPCRPAASAGPEAAYRCREAPSTSATVSTSVFQAPHCGHLPCHLETVPPHSVQA
jgi:hypothetical protein